MAEWHIGCSGFHYDHWRGKFYPEKLAKSKWFAYYCEHFKTLELNVTFYRFPQLSFLQTWYNKSPFEFRFSVKAPRAITHYKKFNDCTALLTSFYDTINNGLQEKLGPVLFQLPPNFHYTEDKLDKIIANLNPAFNNVVEFRHASWWNNEVYNKLAAHHISFCSMSHPDLPADLVQNTHTIYYRFHGTPLLYRSPYSKEALTQVVDTVNANPAVKESWCYFNNDSEVWAVWNAKDMIELSI